MDGNQTPTYERVLAVFESSVDQHPFDPAHLRVLTGLQDASKEHFGKLLDRLLEGKAGEGLPPATVRGAQMLHRRIANALGQAALRLMPRPQAGEEPLRIVELALLSLHARSEEIKWHAFEQSAPDPSSWEQMNKLMRAMEVAGLEREVLGIDATCSDAFAHCLLLATLNVGILTSPQIELAHRWMVAYAREMRVEPFFDPEAHWYQIELSESAGPQRVSPAAVVSDSTRFLSVTPLGPLLARARSQLYSGELSVGATPNRIVALHFGAFLDLAERLWSPDWRRSNWRDDRVQADDEHIEVVLGLDRAMEVLGLEQDAAAPRTTRWTLRDKSASGLGAVLPLDDGWNIALGVLLGFRHAGEPRWQLGYVVRRVRAPDASKWQIGIRHLSDAPLVVELQAVANTAASSPQPASRSSVIYAPITTDTGRVDGLVIDASRHQSGNEFLLATAGGAYHIRANRVMDRGDQWIRIGFEVLGKRT